MSDAMTAPTVIVIAPHGSGKTAHAEALREIFGCTSVVDEWDGRAELAPGTLALTNQVVHRRAPSLNVQRNNQRALATRVRAALEDIDEVVGAKGRESTLYKRAISYRQWLLVDAFEDLLRAALPSLEAALHETPSHPTRTG